MVKISLIIFLSAYYCVIGEYFESKLDDMMTVGWEIDESAKEISITIKVSAI